MEKVGAPGRSSRSELRMKTRERKTMKKTGGRGTKKEGKGRSEEAGVGRGWRFEVVLAEGEQGAGGLAVR